MLGIGATIMSNAMRLSKEIEINTVKYCKPHLVILGAGASKATCPDGDKNGLSLPVMYDFVETLGLSDILEHSGIKHLGRNFEVIYSEISGNERYSDLTKEIEDHVTQYFRKLELPDCPTIYDYLLLSLRSKDVVATFNWDPLLWQAYSRNSSFAEMPTVLYLHGCCAIGYCATDEIQDELGKFCPHCTKELTPTRILFPVTNKDYVSDPYVAGQWKGLRLALKDSFLLTIFGYGAPETDEAAVELMHEAWGPSEKRFLEKIEIIDITSEDELRLRWQQFIHTHHYLTTDDFLDSLLSRHPRRSCEVLSITVRYGVPSEGNQVPRFSQLNDLWNWLSPLIKAEEEKGNS